MAEMIRYDQFIRVDCARARDGMLALRILRRWPRHTRRQSGAQDGAGSLPLPDYVLVARTLISHLQAHPPPATVIYFPSPSPSGLWRGPGL